MTNLKTLESKVREGHYWTPPDIVIELLNIIKSQAEKIKQLERRRSKGEIDHKMDKAIDCGAQLTWKR